jgi:hypothetical protein
MFAPCPGAARGVSVGAWCVFGAVAGSAGAPRVAERGEAVVASAARVEMNRRGEGRAVRMAKRAAVAVEAEALRSDLAPVGGVVAAVGRVDWAACAVGWTAARQAWTEALSH